MIELELLNDQVEIVQEGLFNVLSDVVVKCGLDMERLVRLLNFLDPHVERVKLLLDKVIEVVGGVKYSVNGSHEEREESNSHELKGNRENVFLGGGS